VIAGFGPSADWYPNLQAHPAIEVAIAGQRFRPAHRVLNEPEAVAVLADYEQRNQWAMPLVRRTLTLLVGWDYDGNRRCQATIGT